ncbi:MAG: hypothetical protein J6Q22_05245 [Prevotella sp.]|nr:hypothetical protein [Prevotella sp.]
MTFDEIDRMLQGCGLSKSVVRTWKEASSSSFYFSSACDYDDASFLQKMSQTCVAMLNEKTLRLYPFYEPDELNNLSVNDGSSFHSSINLDKLDDTPQSRLVLDFYEKYAGNPMLNIINNKVTVNSVSINDVKPGFRTFVVDMLTMQRKIRQLKADRVLSNF